MHFGVLLVCHIDDYVNLNSIFMQMMVVLSSSWKTGKLV